jgi:ribosomal protein S18 acetylase RimI-like enzyme
MQLVQLRGEHIPALMRLMEQGAPFIRVRSESDYWLYSELFADSCPVMIKDGQVIGAALAFHSQTNSTDTYIQDVMVHPASRRKGVASDLVTHLAVSARAADRTLIYLTSEPGNTAAHETWTRLGFKNRPGNRQDGGVDIIEDFKGPGKDRAVYDLKLI